MKHGALPRPNHPATRNAHAIKDLVVGLPRPVIPNWFRDWKWTPTGNVLGNDALSDCVEAADVVLVQGFAISMGLPPITATAATNLAETRYEQISGWNGTFPGNDPGTVPEVDCFAWQAVPIAAGVSVWAVRWAIVKPDEVDRAIMHWPLLLTIGLCADDADSPGLWEGDPIGPYIDYHRVVCGAVDGKWLTCRTYGRDYPVSPKRIVGADMMVHLNTPADLRTAGLDWKTIASPVAVA